MKCYSNLVKIPAFEERYNYLKIGQKVGEETFGFDRFLNQALYESKEWRNFRNFIITRDCGLDMALDGHEIQGIIIVHHLNPITVEQIENRDPCVMNPENVVCVSERTHKAIHYGDKNLLGCVLVERTPFDTCPWKLRR